MKTSPGTKLGAMFYNFATNEGIKVIKAIGTPQNQQMYLKL
jgi:hypothetical protein